MAFTPEELEAMRALARSPDNPALKTHYTQSPNVVPGTAPAASQAAYASRLATDQSMATSPFAGFAERGQQNPGGTMGNNFNGQGYRGPMSDEEMAQYFRDNGIVMQPGASPVTVPAGYLEQSRAAIQQRMAQNQAQRAEHRAAMAAQPPRDNGAERAAASRAARQALVGAMNPTPTPSTPAAGVQTPTDLGYLGTKTNKVY